MHHGYGFVSSVLALPALVISMGVLAGCGDDAGGGTALVTSAPQAIRGETPETPWMVIGEDGRVVWFHANPSTGTTNGISMEMPDGRLGYLAIDELTGEPLYWSAEGWIVVFRDWRFDEALVDVGFLGPNGERGVAEDMAFPAPMPPDSLLKDTVSNSSGWATFVSALTGAVGGAVCAGSVIITAGAAVAGVTFPPGGVPLFSASWTGTAWVCGTTTIGFLALRPDSEVREINDEVVTPANLGFNAAKCAGRRDIAACLQGLGDSVNFVMSTGAANEQVEITAFIEEETDSFGVYCCSGPTQIEQGAEGTWRAAVVDGLGSPPFEFTFTFDTDSGTENRSVSSRAHSASAAFTFDSQPGTYGIRAAAVDDAGTPATPLASSATHPSLGPFRVEVVTAALPTLAVPAIAPVSEPVTVEVLIAGGVRPLDWSLSMGDGTTYEGRTAADLFDVEHVYSRSGMKELSLSLRDGDMALRGQATANIDIRAPSPGQSGACHEAKEHLCTNIQGQQCSTATMDRAVGRVSSACGADEAGRFAGVAEVYCTVTTFAGFDVATCAEQ